MKVKGEILDYGLLRHSFYSFLAMTNSNLKARDYRLLWLKPRKDDS
ncbi:hypothetical protein [Helicobacter sp.]|nr:hypothetical protein [Helicobacter sp.]MBD5164573.1 hypothetical protein [Helicobacter sp.]